MRFTAMMCASLTLILGAAACATRSPAPRPEKIRLSCEPGGADHIGRKRDTALMRASVQSCQPAPAQEADMSRSFRCELRVDELTLHPLVGDQRKMTARRLSILVEYPFWDGDHDAEFFIEGVDPLPDPLTAIYLRSQDSAAYPSSVRVKSSVAGLADDQAFAMACGTAPKS